VHDEQFACGLIAAFITKIVVIMLANFLRHPRPSTRYLESNSRSRFRARCDRIKFWVGMALAGAIIGK
jgi:hypothetical protein